VLWSRGRVAVADGGNTVVPPPDRPAVAFRGDDLAAEYVMDQGERGRLPGGLGGIVVCPELVSKLARRPLTVATVCS
jgi:hypothetical protein